MTDQASSTPGAAPGNAPASNNSATPSRPSMPAQSSAQPESNPRARGHSPAADARQQQETPAEAMVKFADGSEHKESDLLAAMGERAEAASRKATLPASADAYEIKLPDNFQAPEGVKFEFDAKDPALKSAREVAHKHGIPQDVFSEMLGVYASTKMGEAIQQSKLRYINTKQLDAAAPQRIEAVATWLQARAGADGKTMANFLRQFPSAPIVKAMEAVMRYQSSQGGADYSQSHPAAQEESAGKIPGYENMSFAQKRAYQMAQAANRPGYRGGGRRGE